MPWQFGAKTPIHQQIADHIRNDILNGKYAPDEQIPPVRQLAIEAGVNPNTVQRALMALEAEGLFETRGTVGRFITTDQAVLDRAREVTRRQAVKRLVDETLALGITREELIRYLNGPDTDADPTSNFSERSDPLK